MFGLGTVDHAAPSQCSMRVWASPFVFVYEPTAQMSVGEAAEMPFSALSFVVAFGLLTALHPAPQGGITNAARGAAPAGVAAQTARPRSPINPTSKSPPRARTPLDAVI